MVMDFCIRLEEIGFKRSGEKSDVYFYSRIVEYDKLKALADYLKVEIQDTDEIVNIFPKKDGTFEVMCFRTTYDAEAAPAFYVIPMGFGAGSFRSYDEPLDEGAKAIKKALFG